MPSPSLPLVPHQQKPLGHHDDPPKRTSLPPCACSMSCSLCSWYERLAVHLVQAARWAFGMSYSLRIWDALLNAHLV